MKHKTVRAVCFSPPKRKYFSEYSTSNTPVEIKFKVDTNSNAEDLVMGNNVAVQYYPNIDFQKVEIPSSVTLATLSNVSVGQLVTVKAKVVHLSPIKVLQSKKTENESGTPCGPFRNNMNCVMGRVCVCSCRGKYIYIF